MVKVEKAKITDAPLIHKLINYFADQSLMLPRSLSEIYEDIRDYFVIRDGERIIACASLHINWADLAEIKSVAVAEDKHKQGIGDKLIRACLCEANEIGIPTIFCLTYQPVFFEKFGFTRLDKMDLPQKVWNECFRCPKFPNCDEVALVYHVEEKS
ncbi:N-acetyltransferase [Chloroflexota bacterium]